MYYDPNVAYQACTCPVEDTTIWYWNAVNRTCHPCPNEGFFCNNTIVEALTSVPSKLQTNRAISVRPGYYPLCNGTLCPSVVNQWPVPTLVSCSIPKACNPHGKHDVFQCADGYDSASMMCSKCLPGYYPVAGRCQACPSSPVASIVGLASVGIIACIAGAYIWKWDGDSSALPSMVMFWFQLSDILATDIAQRDNGNESPVVGRLVASMFGLDDIASFDMSLIGCASPTLLSSSQWEQTLALKVIIWLVLQLIIITCSIGCRSARCLRSGTRNGAISRDNDPAVAMLGFQIDEADLIRTPPSSESIDVENHVCGRFPTRLLMVCYFLIETLYLPLVTQLMQVFLLHSLLCAFCHLLIVWGRLHNVLLGIKM
jgi:hypothetical protein